MKHIRAKKQYNNELRFMAIKMVHFLTVTALFFGAWMFFRYKELFVDPSVKGFRYNYLVTIAYAAILYFFHRTYNAYLLGYNRVRNLVLAQSLSQIFTVGILYFIVSISWNKFLNPYAFLLLLIIQLGLNVIWSHRANAYYFRMNPPKKTIFIYRNMNDRRRFGILARKATENLYHIAEDLQYDGDDFTEIKDRLRGYEAVFVAGVASHCRNGISKYCAENNIPGFFLPHIGDVLMQGAEHIRTFDSPVLHINGKQLKPEYAIAKRAFDIVSSGIALVILSPVMLITAIAIKAYDGGPAFYKQVRLTRGGKEFKILKFRSMRVDAEKDGVARLSSGDNDDRITPIGKIVRKCRLDELPQLINIFKGDMSVVGPRPERPEIAAQYYETMPNFNLRLQVKAGLTGYAQIYGKYNTAPYEKLEFDLLYINSMSFLTDLQLIFATFSILFLPESTEGIEAGAVTAMDVESEAGRAA